MKRAFLAIVIALTIVGCKNTNKVVVTDDKKPVAPTTYTDGKTNGAEPQLPHMLPHWKETSK